MKAPGIFMKSAMKYPEANNEISIMWFHWTSKHYTHHPPGRCLVFIIKMVTTHHQQSLIFFSFFPLFYSYFSLSTAILSICGNVHWTLNPPNIITNHPLFFSIFPYFRMMKMPWENDIKVNTNEIDAMGEWNKSCYKWNRCREWMK